MRPPAGSGGLLGDVPSCQRRRVDDVFVAAAHEHDRILRRDAIEIVAQRQPLFLQLRFVPVAVGDDDIAGLRGRDARAQCRIDIGQRSRARQVDARAAAGAMEMVIHQPRNHAPAFEIDHARRGTGDRAHLIVVADGHDAIADDRDRLLDAEAAIDGDDFAVEQDQVGRRRARQDWTLRRQSSRGEQHAQRGANHPSKHILPLPRRSLGEGGPSIRPSNFANASLLSGRSRKSAAILTRWGRAPALELMTPQRD